jgi:hypothetical protein
MANRRSARYQLALGITLIATLAAGQVEAAALPGFALVAQTQHFSFYSRNPRLKVDADKAEQSLRELSALLGQPVEGRAEFFRHERAEDIALYTGVYSTGFAEQSGERLHSILPNHPHEIVHIVAVRMGQPGDFFQEGLAVALGDHGRLNGVPVERLAKKALARYQAAVVANEFKSVDANAAYAVAGAFVEHLIQTRGLNKVADLFRACADGPGQRDAAFAQIFGRSLDGELNAWAAAL